MTVTLTPEQEALVERELQRGNFSSPMEAVSAALQLLERTNIHAEDDQRRRELRHKYPTLVDLFAASPFRELDIEFTRDKSPMRDIDFG